MAQALDRKLVFQRRDRRLAGAALRRRASARWPRSTSGRRSSIEGAEILPNDRGTAPGQWVEESGAVAMLLPGPPHELKAMFERQCLPRLARIVPKQVIRTLFLRVAGMGESDLDQLIAPVYKKYENPVTTILAAAGDIQIHLRARCATEAEADALLAEVAGPIELLLGDRIYSRNGDPLEVVVGESAAQARTPPCAWPRAPPAACWASASPPSPGSSEYFVGGFLTYNNAMKTELARRTGGILEEHGAVSKRDRRGHGGRRAPPHRLHLRPLHHRHRGAGRGRR